MEAMNYEYLIRRVYNCGRTNINGANADIYRIMEQLFHNFETKNLFEKQTDREYEFRKVFSKVRRHVDDAIAVGIKKIEHVANEEDLDKLLDMSTELDVQFYDKVRIDNIIHLSNDIFHKYGLEIG